MGKFGTTKQEVLANTALYRKYFNNPTNTSLLDAGYQPRLTLYKRGRIYWLKVEFSVPKLIFGNNLEELNEKDFTVMVEKLKKQLEFGGVRISEKNISSATVSGFHASKNIRLKKGYTSIAIIKELEKINLTEKLDISSEKFRNGGHSLQFNSNSHSLVFYDKTKDLSKPSKRAIDKENEVNQLSLLDFLADEIKPEILRMEVRLPKIQKMNSVLKKIGYSENPKLNEVFKKDLCQKLVSYYWKHIVLSKNEFLFEPLNNPQTIIKKIAKKKKIKPKEVIYLTGLYLVSKDMGIRNLRSLLSTIGSQRNWYRLAEDMKKLKLTNYQYDWVKEINDTIERFEPIKVTNRTT